MTARLPIPSAVPAELAERLRDEPVSIRRPTVGEYQIAAHKMRDEIDLSNREFQRMRRGIEDCIRFLREANDDPR